MSKLMKSKKGFNQSVVALMSALGVVAVFVVILAIILGQGSDILSDVRADTVTNTAGCNATHTTLCGYSYNASSAGLEGLDTLAQKQDTLMTIVAVGAIIAILFAAFTFVKGRNQ